MGILGGKEIQKQVELGKIKIAPFDEKRVGPNSYNLTLSNILKVYKDGTLDMKKANETETIIIPEEGFVLKPGELYLGSTNEFTGTDEFVPMLEGRSSLGRLGISIHVTAGFGDIGFAGNWTLEITAEKPVKIYPNIDVCQIYYHDVQGDYHLYRGKYLNQTVPTESRMQMDFDK